MSIRDFPGESKRITDVDILLIDDLQLLSSKKRVQEGFFQGFNVLHSLQKQMAMVGTQYSYEMLNIGGFLRSRLGRELIIKIQSKKIFTSRVRYSIEDIQ